MQDTWGRMRLMKLGQVRSSTSPAGRRRREIGGMAGWTAARPLTSKNMARLPLLTKPDALSIVSDACLGYDRRDVVEGAFRLSFHLEGGARNPFLDTPAAFRAFPRDRGDPALRATSIGVAAGPAFLAIGATFPNRDRFHDEHKTGAGFMALRFAGGITFSARPALTSEGWSAPEGHRRLIEAALTELTAAGDWPQDRVLEGFETAWTAMAKRCGALPWPLTR